MANQTSILYETNPPECWTNLKKFCLHYGLKYNTLSKYEPDQIDNNTKKLFEFNDCAVYRVKNR
jgi:hypothetical protein